MGEASTSSSSGKFHSGQDRRWLPAFLSSHKTVFAALWVVGLASVFIWQRSSSMEGIRIFLSGAPPGRAAPLLQLRVFNLTKFGGVGDGVVLNTGAFERAVAAIATLGKVGVGQLNVEAGVWLTRPFNLTSHMTLFLAEGTVVLGVKIAILKAALERQFQHQHLLHGFHPHRHHQQCRQQEECQREIKKNNV